MHSFAKLTGTSVIDRDAASSRIVKGPGISAKDAPGCRNSNEYPACCDSRLFEEPGIAARGVLVRVATTRRILGRDSGTLDNSRTGRISVYDGCACQFSKGMHRA